ncbi:MAG: cryptochrome/photolyase family protein [Bacteroidetes bacterium]|nr:cryptochrome/photolyase family protein [Bacteroidota bacterium]
MTKNYAVSLVFPHQLYLQHPSLDKGRPVYLVEESLYFTQYPFHQQKIVLHRASMQYYADRLRSDGYTVHYIEAIREESDIRVLIQALAAQQITIIHYTATTDNWLEKRIQESTRSAGMQYVRTDSPNFLNRMEAVNPYFDQRKKYFQTDFYTWQRKERKILLDNSGQPAGGKWTFDTDNRKKIPKGESIPVTGPGPSNDYIKEAIAYTKQHFAHHNGEAQPLFYPITHSDAEAWLDRFLSERFEKFGIYEDAIVASEHFLYHSVLTPMLNIGLLHPQQIIDKALGAAQRFQTPLNSVEGFIRQVMGWREFIRIVYEREGSRQRTTNYWGFTRKIPPSFWNGTTGIVPVDKVIQKVWKTGYSHHIERLMILGNFMLLCEFDPDEVYRWFMIMYADSYDWVMVPNVYGMTQFADGGLMTTKPYISGSNYIVKMSDYKASTASDSWNAIWDGLFWRFMHVHRSFFQQNPRLNMLLHTFDKMPAEKRNAHLQQAESFLNKLDYEAKKES